MKYLMNKNKQLKENVFKCSIEDKMIVKQATNRLGLLESLTKKIESQKGYHQ